MRVNTILNLFSDFDIPMDDRERWLAEFGDSYLGLTDDPEQLDSARLERLESEFFADHDSRRSPFGTLEEMGG